MIWGIVTLVVIALATICIAFPAVIGEIVMGIVEFLGALLEAFCD